MSIILKKSFLILAFVMIGVGAWAAGDIEEQYYVVLNNRDSYFSRQMEKNFYDYARSNNVDLRVHTLTGNTYSDKFETLYNGANNKNPVLIFANYDPNTAKELETTFYNNGEFSVLGYMGSFLIFDEPKKEIDADLIYDIPWQIISLDTDFVTNEILLALGQAPQDDSVHNNVVEESSIETTTETASEKTAPTGQLYHPVNTNFPTNSSQTLLWVIDGFSREEHTINKAVLNQLQEKNNNPNLVIQTMYADPKLDPKSALTEAYKVEGFIEPKDTSIKIISQNSDNTRRNQFTDSFLNTRMYKIMDSYLKNNRTENISVVYANSTIDAMIIQRVFSDRNLPVPQIIAWGLSPEAKQALSNDTMLLAFDYDYKEYTKTIMQEAKILYTAVNNNPITDEMLDGEEDEPKFEKKPEIIFSVTAHRKGDIE